MDAIVSTSSSALTTQRRRLPRLVIVEEHAAVADVLDAGLWGRYRVRSVIATEHRSATATAAAARAVRPDVAIVAVRPGPFSDGEVVMSSLHAAGVPVIALSTVDSAVDPVHWGRCLLAGAVGLLPKTADLADLTRMLDLVLSGRPPLCPALAAQLREAATRAAAEDECWTARNRLGCLSLREREVVCKLMTGRCPAEIAREDFVSEATIRTQIKSILAKLEVSSQLGAVAVVRRAGWSATGHLATAS
jgi:two-component system nitrate/nitrite response regulator NarL